jgi:hypothetical protein
VKLVLTFSNHAKEKMHSRNVRIQEVYVAITAPDEVYEYVMGIEIWNDQQSGLIKAC